MTKIEKIIVSVALVLVICVCVGTIAYDVHNIPDTPGNIETRAAQLEVESEEFLDLVLDTYYVDSNED